MKARSTKNLHDFSNNEFIRSFEITSNINKEAEILNATGLLNDFLTDYKYQSNLNSTSLEILSKIAKLTPYMENIKKKIIEERIEYYQEHGYVNENSSKTFTKMKNLIDLAFDIEEVFSYALNAYWSNTTIGFDYYNNGDDEFAFLVGPPTDDHNPYIKTSLITENQIALQSSKIGIVYEVEKGGVLAMSDRKINLAKTNEDSILTLFKIDNDNYYSSSSDDSKLKLPDELIQKNLNKCLRVNSDYLVYDEANIFNNVILDKSKSTPKGIVIISSLYDFPFEEFVQAKRLQEELNLDIKVISLSSYRNKFSQKTNFAINIRSNTSQEKERFRSQIEKFKDSDELYGEEPGKLLNLIDEFEEFIYDEENQITEKIVKFDKEYNEVFKSEAKALTRSIVDMLAEKMPSELNEEKTYEAMYDETYKFLKNKSSEINVKEVLNNKRKNLNRKLESISKQKEV